MRTAEAYEYLKIVTSERTMENYRLKTVESGFAAYL